MNTNDTILEMTVKCCGCGRIRTPSGWQWRASVGGNSEQLVSHSLCPACLQIAMQNMEREVAAGQLHAVR